MESSASLREFSKDKHRRGHWNTRVVTGKNPVVRAAMSYCSFKRAAVDNLAREYRGGVVLDAGCGKGAYSLWFAAKRPEALCVAADWSEDALRALRPPPRSRILRVCADVRFLPIKSSSIRYLFSIDTLGHVDNCDMALDEFSRVCAGGAQLFLHSECRDYQERWPDRALIKRLGEDVLARYDGHSSLHLSAELYALYSRRFQVISFVNPAGYLVFITGYPEKYRMAFSAAHWRFLAALASVFALLKKSPVLGMVMRLTNAFTNHCEAYFGLKGGGSCFAVAKKP
jgi:ubiquinone/menaquinone biosynthesis C-methylase UbiE